MTLVDEDEGGGRAHLVAEALRSTEPCTARTFLWTCGVDDGEPAPASPTCREGRCEHHCRKHCEPPCPDNESPTREGPGG